jgi:polyphosphate kinase
MFYGIKNNKDNSISREENLGDLAGAGSDIRPRYLNRELSLLAFNHRVLGEAMNSATPLLERVRFLSIAAANQEEFFMVRVAGLKAEMKKNPDKMSDDDGATLSEQLQKINGVTQAFTGNLQNAWHQLRQELEHHNIRILKPAVFSPEQQTWAEKTVAAEIFPVLTPVGINPAQAFPFIPSKGVAIIFRLTNTETGKASETLIMLPASFPRFMKVPGEGNTYVLMEDLILSCVARLFPAPLSVKDHAVVRVLRDAELDLRDDDAEDLLNTFESALKRRHLGHVVRLTVTDMIAPDFLGLLKDQLGLATEDVLFSGDTVGLVDIRDLITPDRRDLQFKTFNPRFPERIKEFAGDCFAAISHKDFVVHHPYETFDAVVDFLRQAAKDPQVLSIKQTIYRTSKVSPIIDALIEAAENGKDVTAVVELKARFDEEANLRWARNMEKAGVRVIFGFRDLKIHSKVSLVMRRENKKIVSYAHFGTGNYHVDTARIYTDLSFFTCDADICQDAMQLFNFMTSYAEPKELSKLVIAPTGLRHALLRLIDNEIKNAGEGKKAQVWAKCNAVTDKEIIEKLYAASRAGVEVDMIVRGICTLRPEVPGLSENIRVKSIVGRYLEHARIYCFANGAELPSAEAKVFISSSDLMPRNLDRRIETLVPILNPTVHKQVLAQIMVANLKDQRNSWLMQPDGSYVHAVHTETPFNAHEYFMNNPSLSGRGRALQAAPAPPHLQLDKRKAAKKQ